MATGQLVIIIVLIPSKATQQHHSVLIHAIDGETTKLKCYSEDIHVQDLLQLIALPWLARASLALQQRWTGQVC